MSILELTIFDYEAEISNGYDASCVCLEVGETVFFVPFVGDLIVFYDVYR